jgi:membrane protease YdiL (CAAX protease family)
MIVSGPSYGQNMKLSSGDLIRVLLILVGGTAINIWGLNWIPLHKLPLSPFWATIFFRACSSALSLLLIRIFCPAALPKFGWGHKPKQLLIALGIVLFLMGSALFRIDYRHTGFTDITMSFIFALFIGIDEDFFSRGFIYGSLERYGMWFAAIVSSVHFGLLHLGNIIWGGQSAAYTIAQVVSAGSFGFLAAALMVFSGSIWVPILMHGLCDFPMQFESGVQYTKMVTGGADWIAVGFDVFIYSLIGWLLLTISSQKSPKILLRLGLIDSPEAK